MAKVQKAPLLVDGKYKVIQVIELAFFDLTGQKAKTKGTSNKSYHAEIQIATRGNRAQIYSMWGPTGGHQTRDWRYYDNKAVAEKDFEKIIKSKKRKGYQEVDVAQRAYGSAAAKKITKAVQLTGMVKDNAIPKSKLALPTQNLVEQLFGATQQFVVTTLKCPLGQLTNAQIDRGRACLNKAKNIVNTHKTLTKPNKRKVEGFTNDFYTLIPHNLGTGSRGQMTHLLLDDINKIMSKEDDLDTLLDAKSVGAVLTANAAVDDKYKELNAELKWIDNEDPIFKFMSEYFLKSKVRRHGFKTAKVKNIWRMDRKDKERECFLANSEKIAQECGKHTFASDAYRLNKSVKGWVPGRRPDLDKEMRDLYFNANTWLCWHGTRSANVVGISKRGLLIRPAGAIITGAMYGPGRYYSWQSTKSLNYTDGGYWTGGKACNTSRFMFLLDVTMGNMYHATRSHYYKQPPKGFHSIYARAGKSGVQNDEMITYEKKSSAAQGRIRYLFEITD